MVVALSPAFLGPNHDTKAPAFLGSTIMMPTIMMPTIMMPTIMMPTIMMPTIMICRRPRKVAAAGHRRGGHFFARRTCVHPRKVAAGEVAAGATGSSKAALLSADAATVMRTTMIRLIEQVMRMVR